MKRKKENKMKNDILVHADSLENLEKDLDQVIKTPKEYFDLVNGKKSKK